MMEGNTDPRLEHSCDLRLNSYHHRDSEPGYRTAGAEQLVGQLVATAVRPYCLTIRNIPAGLTRAGLANIFSQFGDLLECQLGGGRGKVAFSSGVEAATAMAQLDRREPYRMVVDWQVDKEVREKRRMMEQEEKQFAEMIIEEFDQEVGSKLKWDDVVVEETVEVGTDTVDKNKDTETGNASVKSDIHPFPVTSPSPYYQYNHPLSHPPPTTAGLCCRCSVPGLLLCSVCSAWYCSQFCQADHWPRHRLHCGHPPALEGVERVTEVVEELVGIKQKKEELEEIGNFKGTPQGVSNEVVTKEVVGNLQLTSSVVVSYLQSPTHLYIQTVECFPLLATMMAALQSSSPHHTSPPTKLVQGYTVYLAHCEGVWYRVKVVSISPTHSMARVFLIDYGNTDTVHVDRIRSLPTHSDVPGMARRVQLVSIEMEGGWTKEELDRLREIIGEGGMVKLSNIEGNEDDNIVSLEDDQGRNVLDFWRDNIASKKTAVDDNDCIILTDSTQPTSSGQMDSFPVGDLGTPCQMDNTGQDNVQTEDGVKGDSPGVETSQLSNTSQADVQREVEVLTNPAVNTVMDQLSNTGQTDVQREVEVLTDPAVNTVLDQLSNSGQAVKREVLTYPAVNTILDQLSPGCKVQLLKVEAEPWSSFRSICVKDLSDNEEADWVLGGLQVEGGSHGSGGLEEEVGVGELVVAWNKDEQMYYRVVVIRKNQNKEEDNYATVSIDFGREEVYTAAELRRSWEGVNRWPALGIRVESEGRLSKEIMVELNRIGKEGITMDVVKCNNRQVTLAIEVLGKLIRWTAISALAEKENCPFNNFPLPPPPLPTVPAPLPLTLGLHTVYLLSADSPASLSICSMSQYSMLTTTMVPTIQSLATMTFPVPVPVQGSLVLASYGDMWHRAKLVMVSQDHMQARLEDLGHTITVSKDQLLLAQLDVRSWPAVAVPCVMAEWAGMDRDRQMLDTMKDTWSKTMGKLVSKFQQLEVRVISVDESGLHVLHVPAWEGIVKRGGGHS